VGRSRCSPVVVRPTDAGGSVTLATMGPPGASVGRASNLLKSSDGIADSAEIAQKIAQAIGGEAHVV